VTGAVERAQSRLRAKLDENPRLRALYRIGVAVAGGAVLAAGLVLIPYPGPGWLVVFAGLAILATEFVWARRLLGYARSRYDAWKRWLGRQAWPVKLLALAGTAAVVLLTLWLLDTFGLVAGWIGEDWTWLRSPLF
jgi:uncharacterized protein (TIGR02611 family)